MTALWIYEYFLTLKDEVTKFHDDWRRKEPNHITQVRYAWKTESTLSTQTIELVERPR